MGCEVTFHDKVGRDQLAAAIEPMRIEQFTDLLESAIDETVSRRPRTPRRARSS